MGSVRLLVPRRRERVATLAGVAACVLASKPAINVRMDQSVNTLSATVGTRIIAISAKSYPVKFTPARLGCIVSSHLAGRIKHRVTEFIVMAPGQARILFVMGTGGPTGQGLNAVRPVSVRITR